MKKILHKVMCTSFVATILLLLSFLYSVNRVLAEENFLELSVRQEIRVNAPYPKPKEGIHYRLEAQDEAPLPEGKNGYYDFVIHGENTYQLRFQNLSEGTYLYKLYQLTQDTRTLLTPDYRSYVIQLEVFHSPDGIVIRPSMMDEQYHKLASLTFVNQMQVDMEEESVPQTIGRVQQGKLPNTGVVDVMNNLLAAVLLLILLLLLKKGKENDTRLLDDTSN